MKGYYRLLSDVKHLLRHLDQVLMLTVEMAVS